jgi:hypothetical protein
MKTAETYLANQKIVKTIFQSNNDTI